MATDPTPDPTPHQEDVALWASDAEPFPAEPRLGAIAALAGVEISEQSRHAR